MNMDPIYKETTPAFIYLMYAEDLDLYKIGVSKNSSKRIKQIQTGCPYKLTLLKEFKSEFPYKIEKSIHNKFRMFKNTEEDKNLQGEWFCLTRDVVSDFKQICEEFEGNVRFLREMGNPFA